MLVLTRLAVAIHNDLAIFPDAERDRSADAICRREADVGPLRRDGAVVEISGRGCSRCEAAGDRHRDRISIHSRKHKRARS